MTKVNVESRAFEKSMENMSPFEIKNKLISLAEKDAQVSARTFLNAGRGNPNWLLSYPRKAFFLLGQFAMSEADRVQFDKDAGIVASPASKGVAKRFEEFLGTQACPCAKTLRDYYDYMLKEHKVDPDDFVFELVDGIIGDHYPTPDRILKYTQIAIRDYLRWAMGGGDDMTEYDLFATEGSTAGMCYAFLSLQQNFLMNPGDKIALFTPCFTPYIEIPQLAEFGLEVVNISANRVDKDGYHDWQYPREEIDKLRDPSVKCVCITNPSNPPSVCLAPDVLDQLVDVVKKDNPKLMIVSDDVYGTFIDGFKSLMYVLPYNTLCLYSFSKYFGATGWRLAAMALKSGKNVFDDRIAELPEEKRAALNRRYESLARDPAAIRFIDRLVADSRMVGLNHTAGLSTPQQIQMALFANFGLLNKKDLQPRMISRIHERLDALWSTTGFTLRPDPWRAGYYSEIDLMVWARKFYGDEFTKFLNDNYEPLDFVIRLANDTAVVLLNGDGFDGPKWSVRASLANLDKDAYLKIGVSIKKQLEEYHQAFLKSKK